MPAIIGNSPPRSCSASRGDFNWSSFKASNTTCFGPCGNDGDPLVASSQLDHFSSFRARFGLTSDRTLLYVTGGPAFGHIKASMAVLEWAACGQPRSALFSARGTPNPWGRALVGGGAN